MKKTLLVILSTIFIFSCQTDKKNLNTTKYPRWIGDIEQDSLKDNSDFKVCNGDDKIFQYFNTGDGPEYVGEKSSILKKFKTEYKPVKDKNQNGLIRIRFIVNCKGKAGRFRVLQSDFDYNEIKFNETIVSQLVSITKKIENWEIKHLDNEPLDYYFYLVFKMKEGLITEILP